LRSDFTWMNMFTQSSLATQPTGFPSAPARSFWNSWICTTIGSR
jgi:hypothetical protein